MSFFFFFLIFRALEVFINSGNSLSSILNDQRNTPGGCNLGGPLRYNHIIIFWVKCEQVSYLYNIFHETFLIYITLLILIGCSFLNPINVFIIFINEKHI